MGSSVLGSLKLVSAVRESNQDVVLIRRQKPEFHLRLKRFHSPTTTSTQRQPAQQ